MVSDVRIYRDGIVAAFANAPGLGCVAIARLGITGLNDILGTRPDVVVVDMGAREALDSCALCAARCRRRAWSPSESTSPRRKCWRAPKPVWLAMCAATPPSTLCSISSAGPPTTSCCSPRIAASLFRRIASLAERAVTPADALTLREQQVLALIREGLGNKEIADQLRISLATVKNHVHNVLEKLHVTRRAQAARIDALHTQQRFG